MKFLRSLFTVLIVLAMVAVGVLFALQNETPVPLDLLVYHLPPRSLALWVLGALALGGILGLSMSSFLLLRQRAALGSANRQLARTRQEVDKLRTAGLTEGE
jgi:uncharacterized membrane protein YciS (DUF1049 family)